ncbi:unnamed protein product [Musa banksii]
MFAEFKNKSNRVAATIRSSTMGVVVIFLALLVLVFSTFWIANISVSADYRMVTTMTPQAIKSNISHSAHPAPKRQPKPIALTCGNQTAVPICQRQVSASVVPSRPPTMPQSSASCPDYFRWIYEDLRPWKTTGITREMVESAQKFATFRLVVLDGRVYVEHYGGGFQTRDVFTLWGLLQLANRYPGRIPDIDLMFNCNDTPSVKSAGHRSSPPPPLFRYCKDDKTLDIVFPDWSFWGWAEVNIKPWRTVIKELEEGNRRVKWRDREPYAYWKGNPWVSDSRSDLMRCNVSKHHDWNARLYALNWDSEKRQGYNNSNLASQCKFVMACRYKIFVEGRAWSVSNKYILACDSPALFVKTRFHDFFSRGLMPGLHYWPIREDDKCSSIKFAVDWGNKHQEEAEAMGRVGSSHMKEEVKMEYVYDYILHLLIQYAKLLRYKPTVPEKAIEFCLESVACPATGIVKKLLMESMEKWTEEAEPCRIPPPFSPEELQEIMERKANVLKQIESWEEKKANI